MADSAALPATPTAPRDARRFLSAFGRERDVPAELLDDAVLLVSETVGNSVLHARSGTVVTARYGAGVLRVEVSDDSPVPPALRDADPEATGGRGVLILDSLASRWGINVAGTGKTVWFELTA